MELFLSVSGVGTLVLLFMHMVDYALEAMGRSAAAPWCAVCNQEAAIGNVPLLREVAERYDRAA